MNELTSSECHFIRCVKSNEAKKSKFVDSSYCLNQIRYLGVLESIRIRTEGFAFRKNYKQFYKKYYLINIQNPKYDDLA
jgi:myosin heavy subunit